MTDQTTTTNPETTGTGEQAQPQWHEDARFDAHRGAMTAKGLTGIADPMEAMTRVLDMQANAEKKLGRPADQLLARPDKDQPLPDWMRQNRELFGIAETPEAYDVQRPENWPKDAPWDDALEAEARKVAYEEGLSGKALQRMTDAYAGAVSRMLGGAEEQLATAKTAMMSDLEKQWGSETTARIARAQQSANVVGEQLGLDRDGIAALAQSLQSGTGDAGVIRLFDLIGDLLGNDRAEGLGKGGGSLGMTAEAAKAELEALRKPGGEYNEAVQKNDRAALARLKPRIEQLSKVAAG